MTPAVPQAGIAYKNRAIVLPVTPKPCCRPEVCPKGSGLFPSAEKFGNYTNRGHF